MHRRDEKVNGSIHATTPFSTHGKAFCSGEHRKKKHPNKTNRKRRVHTNVCSVGKYLLVRAREYCAAEVSGRVSISSAAAAPAPLHFVRSLFILLLFIISFCVFLWISFRGFARDSNIWVKRDKWSRYLCDFIMKIRASISATHLLRVFTSKPNMTATLWCTACGKIKCKRSCRERALH